MPMTTGSDTRMYSPRSESNLGYSKDDGGYDHGIGDPETMEQLRDQKMKEKEQATSADDLPHLQLSIPKPEPQMPPMMSEEEEEPPMMDDQFNEGQQFGAMTGMPDMGNLSIGNATGTMPAPGGMLATGEPMADAWSELLKGRELEDFLQEYPGVRFQSEEVYDNPLSDEALSYGKTTHGKTSYLDPVGDNARSRTMNPQRMAILQRFMASKPQKNPTVVQQVHGNVENPYFTPPDMQNPPLEREGSVPAYENEAFYDTFDDEEPATQEAMDDFRRRYGIRTGEPMEDAWSTLMKSRLDDAGKARPKNWRQSQFETQPGGARIETATSRRAKQQSRSMGGHKKRGLDEAPLSVHRTHLGIDTKQPLRMFPQKYGHQMATQARRKLMGNVPQIPAGHGLGPETSYQPKTPKMASGKGLKLTEPKLPREMGRSFGKSVDLIKEDIEDLQKMRDYLHLSQLRRLLRQLKETAERQERRLKAAVSGGPGNNREAGHREGQDSTTKPEGGTENLEDDPKNWGAPSTMFVARGSGRVG